MLQHYVIIVTRIVVVIIVSCICHDLDNIVPRCQSIQYCVFIVSTVELEVTLNVDNCTVCLTS